MFDKSFQRSKTYFTVLETLRISRDWVEDVIKNWDGLGEQWSRLQTRGPNPIFHEADLRAMSHNWESITLAVHEKAQSLLDRIDRKTEEVKSLRDGLFNATSLREATKGMALNRAVYVFTIITVFYTPLGFMTVRFQALRFIFLSC
ncbi:hypothetical protein B0H66DRAFT_465134 [Apodospora peruviana]|uniref:Uncharacterized protein n=1 Tax=Apodospora peruviana TaxID=516989 RepID=A0AAE0MG63_9PEZI|nr:hypothetical protein B0H66DRAFT_465134 [Apodospora peruviana]